MSPRATPTPFPPLTHRLRRKPPLLHGEEDYWGLAWPALAWLEDHLRAGMTTVETGTGASTIVFAASGADHVAVSPSSAEHERIAAYCAGEGIDTSRVRFVAETSDKALAGWDGGRLDLALIDGAHEFPWPALDWFNLAPHLNVGGWLLVDDAFLPAVNVLVRHLRRSPSWRLAAVPGYRTAVFEKLDDAPPGTESQWGGGRLGRSVSFDYLPPGRRLVAWGRSRFLDRSPLAHLVRRRGRRRSGSGTV